MDDVQIISHFNFNEPYYKFCREEQNFVAILYSLLLSESENVNKLLDIFHIQYTVEDIKNYEIYIEYSFIRDLWSQFTVKKKHNRLNNNKLKKDFILNYLRDSKIQFNEKHLTDSTQQFNQYFGCNSVNHIQSPSNWNVKAIKNNIYDVYKIKDDFLELCKFKWSFNIKPDLVIKLGIDKYICIEAKLESSESSYPSISSEKKIWDSIFGERLERIKQIELQKYMFSKIIGCKDVHFLVIDKKGENHNTIGWQEIFDNLIINNDFTQRFVRLNRNI